MVVENLSPNATPSLIIGAELAGTRAETGDIAGAQAIIAELQPLVDAMPSSPPTAVLGRARAIVRLKQGRIGEARRELNAAEAIFREAGVSSEFYLRSLAALRARIDATR